MPRLRTRRQAGSELLAVAVATGAAVALTSRALAATDQVVQVDARPEPFSLDKRKTALLVVDMQNDFGSKGGMFERAGIDISGIQAVVPAVKSALAAARAARLPIVYLKMAFKPDLSDAGPATAPNLVKHAPLKVGASVIAPDGSSSRILIRDTWNTEIIPDLRPEAGDTILYKTRFSGFFNTGLDDLLRKRGIDTLVVTGCTTSICVESTVRDAMFRDYRCLVLEDCSAEPIGSNEPRTNHEASLLAMQMLFAWISDSQRLGRALA